MPFASKTSRSSVASFTLALAATALFGVADVRAATGPIAEGGVNWTAWKAGNEIDSVASLQRGARNFMNYCSGCHSIKYKRYSRLAEDLRIPEEDLEKYLILPGDKKSDYIVTALSAADGEADVHYLSLADRCPELGEPVTLYLAVRDRDAQRGALKPDARGRSWRGDAAALQRLLQAAV